MRNRRDRVAQRLAAHFIGLIFCCMASLLAAIPAFAQEADVTAYWEMDMPPETGWTVGDLIPLRLRVVALSDAQIAWPQIPETWGDFEIRSQEELPSTVRGDRTTYILSLTAVLWEPGVHETPPTGVQVTSSGGAVDVEARSLQVEIVTVLPQDVERSELDKRDLKPQIELPRPPVWPWIVAGVAALPLLFLAGRWLWHRRPHRVRRSAQPDAPVTVVDTRFPEEIAYETLSRIDAMNLPALGVFKQHYTMLADCMRTYLAGVYGIPAMDQTTYELLSALRARGLDSDARALLRDLVDEADLVKFARFQPSMPQAYDAAKVARHFVDISKPDRQAAVSGKSGE